MQAMCVKSRGADEHVAVGRHLVCASKLPPSTESNKFSVELVGGEEV
jgi:hypothetical protein